MNETKVMKVTNPYNDTTEDLICEFELFFSKEKLEAVCLSSIMSKADINLMGWLKTERLEEIEQAFLKEWEG